MAKKPKRGKPKPIIVPKWGAYLAALRGKVRPGVVVRKLRKMGAEFEKMSSAQQTYYEQGRVERPDPLEAKTSKSARKLDIPQNDARRAIRRKS